MQSFNGAPGATLPHFQRVNKTTDPGTIELSAFWKYAAGRGWCSESDWISSVTCGIEPLGGGSGSARTTAWDCRVGDDGPTGPVPSDGYGGSSIAKDFMCRRTELFDLKGCRVVTAASGPGSGEYGRLSGAQTQGTYVVRYDGARANAKRVVVPGTRQGKKRTE